MIILPSNLPTIIQAFSPYSIICNDWSIYSEIGHILDIKIDDRLSINIALVPVKVLRPLRVDGKNNINFSH